MSIELVRADLAAAGAGLERARMATTAADRAVERIAAHAAGSGFTGIADHMSGVRAGIREVGAGIEAVVTQVDEAAMATAEVSGQATPQDAIASLMAMAEKLDGVHGGIGNVLQVIDRAKQLVEAALRGGKPGPLRPGSTSFTRPSSTWWRASMRRDVASARRWRRCARWVTWETACG